MKNIVVFYHVFAINDWFSIFDSQIKILEDSKLLFIADKIIINIISSDYNYAVAKDYIEKIGCTNIELLHQRKNMYEYSTLSLLQKYAKQEDSYILYIHSKGVANIEHAENSRAWREYMEYFCIENWQNCIDKLKEGFDCCGVNYWLDMKTPHFSGNFWWANSNYINQLPELEIQNNINRTYYEFWIGINKPKAHSFCDNGNAFYTTKIERKDYEAKKNNDM